MDYPGFGSREFAANKPNLIGQRFGRTEDQRNAYDFSALPKKSDLAATLNKLIDDAFKRSPTQLEPPSRNDLYFRPRSTETAQSYAPVQSQLPIEEEVPFRRKERLSIPSGYLNVKNARKESFDKSGHGRSDSSFEERTNTKSGSLMEYTDKISTKIPDSSPLDIFSRNFDSSSERGERNLFQNSDDQDFRSHLLKIALEEKRKLGLEDSLKPKTSSALESLRGYGQEVMGYQTNDYMRSKDLSTEQLPSNQGIMSTDKPLRSILKSKTSEVKQGSETSQELIGSSFSRATIDIDDVQDEEEFLYGSSIGIEEQKEVSPACNSEINNQGIITETQTDMENPRSRLMLNISSSSHQFNKIPNTDSFRNEISKECYSSDYSRSELLLSSQSINPKLDSNLVKNKSLSTESSKRERKSTRKTDDGEDSDEYSELSRYRNSTQYKKNFYPDPIINKNATLFTASKPLVSGSENSKSERFPEEGSTSNYSESRPAFSQSMHSNSSLSLVDEKLSLEGSNKKDEGVTKQKYDDEEFVEILKYKRSFRAKENFFPDPKTNKIAVSSLKPKTLESSVEKFGSKDFKAKLQNIFGNKDSSFGDAEKSKSEKDWDSPVITELVKSSTLRNPQVKNMSYNSSDDEKYMDSHKIHSRKVLLQQGEQRTKLTVRIKQDKKGDGDISLNRKDHKNMYADFPETSRSRKGVKRDRVSKSQYRSSSRDRFYRSDDSSPDSSFSRRAYDKRSHYNSESVERKRFASHLDRRYDKETYDKYGHKYFHESKEYDYYSRSPRRDSSGESSGDYTESSSKREYRDRSFEKEYFGSDREEKNSDYYFVKNMYNRYNSSEYKGSIDDYDNDSKEYTILRDEFDRSPSFDSFDHRDTYFKDDYIEPKCSSKEDSTMKSFDKDNTLPGKAYDGRISYDLHNPANSEHVQVTSSYSDASHSYKIPLTSHIQSYSNTQDNYQYNQQSYSTDQYDSFYPGYNAQNPNYPYNSANYENIGFPSENMASAPDVYKLSGTGFCDPYSSKQHPTSSVQNMKQGFGNANLKLIPIQDTPENTIVHSDTSQNFGFSTTNQSLSSIASSVPLNDESFSHSSQNTNLRELKFVPDKRPIPVQEYKYLTNRQNNLRKQLDMLQKELDRLNKLQGGMMRKQQKVKDGHKDVLILENNKLQDEVIKKINHVKNSIDAVEKILKDVRPTKMICKEEKDIYEAVDESSKDQPEHKSEENTIKFNYFDPGSHWCKLCNELSSSVYKMLLHLHSGGHKPKMNPYDRPWDKDTGKKEKDYSDSKEKKAFAPIKGVQFLIPITGYYCKLCKTFLGDAVSAEEHVTDCSHNLNYQKFTLFNPVYERRWNIDKGAGLALIEREKIKRVQDSEHEKIAKRIKKEEEMQKRKQEFLNIESKSRKDIKELDEELSTSSLSQPHNDRHTSSDKNKTRGIKLTLLGDKSKHVIKGNKAELSKPAKETKPTAIVYIGRAPNFKSKLSSKQESKPSGFGKFSWKKDSKNNTGSEDANSCSSKPVDNDAGVSLEPKNAEDVDSGTVKKEFSSSEIPGNIPLRKKQKMNPTKPFGPELAPQSGKDTNNSDNNSISEMDIAKAFAGTFLPEEDKNKEKLPAEKSLNETEPAVQNQIPTTSTNNRKKENQGSQFGNNRARDTVESSSSLTPALFGIPIPPPSNEPHILTEEEEDFLLLGIDKSDMRPIAIPRPPPQIKLKGKTIFAKQKPIKNISTAENDSSKRNTDDSNLCSLVQKCEKSLKDDIFSDILSSSSSKDYKCNKVDHSLKEDIFIDEVVSESNINAQVSEMTSGETNSFISNDSVGEKVITKTAENPTDSCIFDKTDAKNMDGN